MYSARAIGALLVISCVALAPGDVLWDNGSFDGRCGLVSSSYWDSWAADDFIVAAPIRIQQVTAEFYVPPPDDPPSELGDIGIWTEPVPGEGPQDLVIELSYLPITWEKIGEGFGYDIIAATVDGLEIELEQGDYFFSMRLGGGWSWAALATTGDGVIKGRDAGWYFPLHPPFWYPARIYVGYDSDFAFRLEGIPEPTTAALLLFGLIVAARRR